MDKTLLKIKYKDAEPIARKYFIEISGLGADAANHRLLLDEALQVLQNCKDGINLEAVIFLLSKDCFFDSTIHMSKSDYTCTAFQQIAANDVEAVYVYFLSLGECKSGIKNQAEQYYADLWANGFLEAGRQILRDKIRESGKFSDGELFISCPFGPGFYGMPPDRLSDMLSEIEETMVGRMIDWDGNLPREKLSGGFFFVTGKRGVLPAEECRDCIGHDRGCMFCGGKNVIPSRKACLDLLNSYGTPSHVIRHCKAVSNTAVRIAKALNEKGANLDLALLEAATLLHDIARVEENHGVKGAAVLEKCGYRQVAKLVKCHMFYATDPFKEMITEQDILCLADRMVKEDQYVGLDIRMRSVLEKLIDLGVDTDRVRHRMEENRLIKDRIEEIIGKPIDTLMK
ncbi:hypothetical protein MASR2M70_01580 [Bacillota bacterium]